MQIQNPISLGGLLSPLIYTPMSPSHSLSCFTPFLLPPSSPHLPLPYPSSYSSSSSSPLAFLLLSLSSYPLPTQSLLLPPSLHFCFSFLFPLFLFPKKLYSYRWRKQGGWTCPLCSLTSLSLWVFAILPLYLWWMDITEPSWPLVHTSICCWCWWPLS